MALPVVWDEAIRGDAAAVIAGADLIALATDDYRANRAAMRWAMARGIDVVEAMIYPEGASVEHVVTWGSVLAAGGGCGTCHTKGRFDAFAAGDRPPADLPTHILAAELSCVHGALLIVSRLHQRAGSPLPIAGIARAFERHPFHLTRLLPSFWAAPGEPFADARRTLPSWRAATPSTRRRAGPARIAALDAPIRPRTGRTPTRARGPERRAFQERKTMTTRTQTTAPKTRGPVMPGTLHGRATRIRH